MLQPTPHPEARPRWDDDFPLDVIAKPGSYFEVTAMSYETGPKNAAAPAFTGPTPLPMSHRHPDLPRPVPEGISNLFWLALLAAGSLALGVTVYGAYNSLPKTGVGPEKDLRSGLASSTFKATRTRPDWQPATLPPADEAPLQLALKESTEPPLLPLPMPVEELPLPTVPPPTLNLPPPPPPPVVSVPVELPRTPPVDPWPVLDEHPLILNRASNLGDTPMSRNWKTLALYSLTFVTIAAPAPVVLAQNNDDVKKVIERLDKLDGRLDKMDTSLADAFKNLGADISTIKGEIQSIKNQVSTLNKDLAKLQTETLARDVKLDGALAKLEQLETQLKGLRSEFDANKSIGPKTAAPILDKAGLDDLRTKLGSIEQAILKLQPPQSRVALAPPAANNTGRVMLVNLYGEELLFVVNAKTYRVAAGATLPLDAIPAGTISYEVMSPTWGLRARRSTNLAANETFTLTAQ